VTVRNLFAEPILHPSAESWYAQSLPAFLSNYNVVAVMSMPEMENAKRANSWLKHLALIVAAKPDGIQKTVFELQSVDWRTGKPVPESQFARQIRLLQGNGAIHFAYYPDDVEKNNPAIKRLIPLFSASSYPAPQP
jgi:biofilm PGA synthesis lipoprotein PgaB